MQIIVHFEAGGFNTLAASDSIIDQYATLTQAESQRYLEEHVVGCPV